MDEALLEAIIHHLQQWHGYSNDKDMPQFPPYSENWGHIREELIQFGFIVPNKPGLTLTKEGWTFTSFEKIRQEKKLQQALVQASIDTNKSITDLNTKTDTFYEKQKKYNNVQKFLTVAILISSAVYTVVSILSYNETKHNSIKEQRLEVLEKTLKDKTTKDSIFQKIVKDSLRIKP